MDEISLREMLGGGGNVVRENDVVPAPERLGRRVTRQKPRRPHGVHQLRQLSSSQTVPLT